VLKMKLLLAAAAALSLSFVPASAGQQAVSLATLADGGSGRDWAGYGRTVGQQHFTPLTAVNRSNISRLGLAWSYDLPPVSTVTEPLAVGGVL
jgi:quinohemoprotein ethanol dehydrogenase